MALQVEMETHGSPIHKTMEIYKFTICQHEADGDGVFGRDFRIAWYLLMGLDLWQAKNATNLGQGEQDLEG